MVLEGVGAQSSQLYEGAPAEVWTVATEPFGFTPVRTLNRTAYGALAALPVSSVGYFATESRSALVVPPGISWITGQLGNCYSEKRMWGWPGTKPRLSKV